ncbi:hypothetical protein JR316_0012651 [Psilocybe cubensis]|uniref:Uncharacterized protein n=1 Tax=Psilocybe cubensis TaxID=181762 RepID=A0ACB8GIN5_PSICU|nr:hypothetical protein JR316_0012651 [Psilocybe cubensis]KAH9475536.1 hypothetical protein JR316_0012651 [Psilocybe cubensis]
MFSRLFLLGFLSTAANLISVNAYTGRGKHLPSSMQLPLSVAYIHSRDLATWDSLGTTPCPVQCPTTDYRVALPVDMFPNGENCCSTVHVSYQGTNIDVTFTDLFLAGEGSFNISLSHQAFAELAPLELGQISPVVWNI